MIKVDHVVPGAVRIDSGNPGPRAVIFSGIHGDEISGIHAVEKLFLDIFLEELSLRRGSLTIVRGNKEAILAEKRYIKYNLNRLFKESYPADIDQTSYEFKRAQELKTILENCDYFLDLHSAPFAQAPFMVAEEKAVPFYSRLGIPKIMTGWSKFSGGTIGGDAENYANQCGALSATLESGSHFNKSSNDIAYRSVRAFLVLLEMTPGELAASQPLEIVDVYAVLVKEASDFHFLGEVDNFRPLANGQAYAIQGGRELRVTEDSYLLIPMKPEETRIGEEVGYLGRKV